MLKTRAAAAVAVAALMLPSLTACIDPAPNLCQALTAPKPGGGGAKAPAAKAPKVKAPVIKEPKQAPGGVVVVDNHDHYEDDDCDD